MQKVTKTYKVAGVSYRQREIESLLALNDDYKLSKKKIIDEGMEDEPIYKYEIKEYPVNLVPEPENKYDPNAIKVVISGTHVGYIKKEDLPHIRKEMDSGHIQHVSGIIMGGPSKKVVEDENGEYQIERDDFPLYIELTVIETDDSNASSDHSEAVESNCNHKDIEEEIAPKVIHLAPAETKSFFCQNCGAKLSVGSKFCSSCGRQVGQVKEANQQAAKQGLLILSIICILLGLVFLASGAKVFGAVFLAVALLFLHVRKKRKSDRTPMQ